MVFDTDIEQIAGGYEIALLIRFARSPCLGRHALHDRQYPFVVSPADAAAQPEQERIDVAVVERITFVVEQFGIPFRSFDAVFVPAERSSAGGSGELFGFLDGSHSEIRKHIEELKNSIRALGNVNVNAIEDYKEISERYEFMKSQHDDLKQAEQTLLQIIDELDAGMRRQFQEKFIDTVPSASYISTPP